MSYVIKPVMTIHSATLELTGEQLQLLAAARPYLNEVRESYSREFGSNGACAGLDPVAELLAACAAIVDGATMAPQVRRGRGKGNPTAARSA